MPIPTLRPAQPTATESIKIAAVHVRAWQAAYRGLLPDAYLDALSITRRSQRWHGMMKEGALVVVTELAERITGFVTYGACLDGDADAQHGEIYAIYVHPEFWGNGHGALLMQYALKALDALEYRKLSLWVLDGNTRAIAFYTRFGFVFDGETKTDIRTTPRLRLAFFERRMVRQVPEA